MMVIALLGSLFPTAGFAAEEELDYLVVSPTVKPSEGGALKIVEKDGQMTLGDQNGNPIQLRGMSTHGLQWFPEIINNNAFAALSNDWGANMIRLAMYVGENGYATSPDVIKQRLINGIDYAIANDMYVIVDWHVHAPGNPNEEVYSGAMDFFDEISSLYPNNPYIIYELVNEPSSNNNGGEGVTNDEAGWLEVKNYAQPIVDMLREKGNENLIIVGSPNWSQRPDLAADNPIDDDNTIYTVHFYSGSHAPATDSSDRTNVMSNVLYALENGVAVFASEWGTSEANGNNGPYLDEADVWLNFFNKNNISWANWSLTNKNETSGAFTPFELGKSDATNLDPGSDQVWAPEELSVSGEYVRARIKGIPYEPIDRTKYTKVAWDFNDGTTGGFGVNSDSPVKDGISVSNVNNALKITGLNASNDISADNFWGNVRLSADNWDTSINILGAEELSMDVFVDEPTTVSIGAVPQGPASGWGNPVAVQVNEEDFTAIGDQYKATLTLTVEQAQNLGIIATHEENNEMDNIILFVGTENADEISLDNITVTGTEVEIPVINDPKGEATFPSDFEDGTRQGWEWQGESGVKTALTIQEANGSNALSFEFAYPEVKPTDNWATAPRLDFWSEDLVRGENDYVAFDLYLDPIRATDGGISVNLTFQPPALNYWAQATETFDIDLTTLDEANVTADGLYHYEAKINISDIENLQADTALRNMILIFADDNSDFAGTLFVDNVRFEKAEEPGTEEPGTEEPGTEEPGTEEPGTEEPGTEEPGTEAPGTEEPGTEEPGTEEPGTDKPSTDNKDKNELPNTATNSFNSLLIGFVLLLSGVITLFFIRRKATI